LKEVPEGFYGFDPISLDTFALLSKYTNGIYLINRKGEIIYKKDYSKYMLKGIELWRPFEIANGKLVAAISYRGGIDTLGRRLTDAERKKYEHDERYYYRIFIDSAFFDQRYSDVSAKLDSLKNRYTKNSELAIEGENYLIAENTAYYVSGHSDSIYIFDSKYKLNKIKKIHSNYYKIDCRPIKIKDYEKNMNLNNENVWSHSFIQTLIYDKYRKVFYCIIRGPGDIITRYMPFSIIVMDENLNSLYEQKFDGHVYNPFVFVGKKGLYIHKMDKKEISKRKYEIFSYE
jgi:hypothetical protein